MNEICSSVGVNKALSLESIVRRLELFQEPRVVPTKMDGLARNRMHMISTVCDADVIEQKETRLVANRIGIVC
jgi:hypothetical protein